MVGVEEERWTGRKSCRQLRQPAIRPSPRVTHTPDPGYSGSTLAASFPRCFSSKISFLCAKVECNSVYSVSGSLSIVSSNRSGKNENHKLWE